MKNGDPNFDVSKIIIDYKNIEFEMKNFQNPSNSNIYDANKISKKCLRILLSFCNKMTLEKIFTFYI